MIDLSKFFRYKFNTIQYVQEIDDDIYLFVSKDDEVTYIENARNLKEHIKKLKFYQECSGLSHKELLWDEDVVSKINGVLR
jgi:hypothetical protein